MKKSFQFITLIFLLIYFNKSFSQDYYELSKIFYRDTKSIHINFLKKAIQENNAEQLVIDYLNLISDREKDKEETELKYEAIEDNFNTNYKDPDYVYECKKVKYYKEQAESAYSRGNTLNSLVNMAKTAYNLCKNNPYKTGNCNEAYNNYNRQVNLYNNTVEELRKAKDNVEYYRTDCNQIIENYNEALKNLKRKKDNVLAEHKARFNIREKKLKDYYDQIKNVLLDTPMFTIEYHDNGNKHKEGYVDLRTNKYVGLFKQYYANGKLELECTFKNEQFDGNYTVYYDTGIKKTEIVYDNGKVLSRKEYNEKGVDEQAIINKNIQDNMNEIFAANDQYYKTIDNSSVEESIDSNPIRTIKEGKIELVIDFSKASKETINFFLVRPEHEKSKEFRKVYITDVLETDGGKVSHKILREDGKAVIKAIYDGKIITITEYEEDRSYQKYIMKNRYLVGIPIKYDKNGNRIKVKK